MRKSEYDVSILFCVIKSRGALCENISQKKRLK